MEIHPMGHNGVAIYIDTDELAEYGCAERELDERRARQFALAALRTLGLHTGGGMEIEAYTGADGVMVFAVLAETDGMKGQPSGSGAETDTVAFFTFAQTDDALDALSALLQNVSPPQYTLCILDGIPVLTVQGSQNTIARISLPLAEYGCRRQYPPEYLLFLREHAKQIRA